jgi:hypothetical protein
MSVKVIDACLSKEKPILCNFFHSDCLASAYNVKMYSEKHWEIIDRFIKCAVDNGVNSIYTPLFSIPLDTNPGCARPACQLVDITVNNGEYSFFRDTALPTVGIQRLPDRWLHRDPETRTFFRNAMAATVRQLESHPSIFLWTVFNEGWGQFCADEMYQELRALDATRWIDTTSGWFRRKETDVDSRHVYFRKVQLEGDGKKPLFLSEFGGKTYRAEGHIFNPEKVYGYGGCETLEALASALEELYLQEVLPCIGKGLCAAVYTQVSDVEDEINGLLTYDRKVCKVTPETMVPLAQKLMEAVR